jgi:uncharacterized protein YjbJ (UPF0337 family)
MERSRTRTGPKAAGDLTGNKGLKRRGRADRAGVNVKRKIDGAIDRPTMSSATGR